MDEKVMEMLSKIFEEVSGIKNDVSALKGEVSELSNKVDKNSILLESTGQHVKFIGEGLGAFREQVDRQFDEVHASLDVLVNTFGNALPSGLLEANQVGASEMDHVSVIDTEEGLIRDIALPISGVSQRHGSGHCRATEKENHGGPIPRKVQRSPRCAH